MPYWKSARYILVIVNTVVLLVLINGLMAMNTQKMNERKAWVSHTREVLLETQNYLNKMLDAETGQRGYIITDDEAFLRFYKTAIILAPVSLRRLEKMSADNPQQVSRIEWLIVLTESKLTELHVTVQTRRDEGFDAARKLVKTRAGKNTMDTIRQVVSQIVSTEEALLKIREAKYEEAFYVVFGCVAAVVIRDILISIWAFQVMKPEKGVLNKE